MPSIEELSLDSLDATMVPGVGIQLAVSPSGAVTFVGIPESAVDGFMKVVDSVGGLVASIGPRGAGPGELRMPMFFAFTSDSTLLVWDLATYRFTEFSLSGTALATSGLDAEVRPLALVGDSVDVQGVMERSADYQRRPLAGGRGRRLIPGAHPALDSIQPPPNVLARGMIIYGANQRRVAIGNAQQYRILLFDEAGQYLGQVGHEVAPQFPTLEQLEAESLALQKQPLSDRRRAELLARSRSTPRLFFRELRFDGAGRLWVVRPESGSAVADVYADTVLLGSLPLDCPGYASSGMDVNGRWLALSCRSSDPNAPSDGTLRLFRVLEPVP